MRRRTRFLVILLVIFALWLEPAGTVLAETAVSVQMMKTEGTVTVTNSSARELKILEKMRLYNGYFVSTDEKSYAWMSLDDTKLAKLDALSRMELRKDGKKLQLLVHEGTLFFNVTEPLEEDETLDICTATMVAGIRGTCGWIRETDGSDTEVCILEGETSCTFTSPVTGKQETRMVCSGEIACFRADEEGTGSIDVRRAEQEEIPGFVLKELAGDTGLKEKIFRRSGIDLRDLTEEEAAARQEEEEADTARKLDQIAAGDSKERAVSKDPVWKAEDDVAGKTAEPTIKPTTEPVVKPEIYTVTYMLDGVQAGEVETYEYGAYVTVREKAAKEGYTVSDWSRTGSFAMPAGNIVITASSTINRYTVTYMLDGVQAGEVETYEYDEMVTVREKAVKEGYTVSDWSRTGSFTMPAENVVITAGSTSNEPEVPTPIPSPSGSPINRYTVTYMLDGVQAGEAETYEYGEMVTVREKAVKEGYTVSDWSRTGSFAMPAENVVITAGSTINRYTVTYMLDGVQAGEAETYEYGEVVTVREKAAKEGYTVSDWSRTGNFAMPAENVVITAGSTINTYTVTFNANGGTLTGSQTITADYNTTVILPEPARAGYDFQGWFTEAENGTPFTAAEAVTKDCTLYAYWTAAEAKIVFDANGGSGEPTGITGLTDAPISAVFPAGEPVRQRYTFAGWNSSEDGSGEAVSAYPEKFPAGTITYYAKWDYNTGDFTVVGGTPETDYSYSETNRVLTVLTGTEICISGTTTEDTIAVADGIEANVTLSGVSIEKSYSENGFAPFTLPDGASATITLAGDNTLMDTGHAALEKNGTTGSLTIKGSGSLKAEGLSGIGATAGSTGNITIESGTITAAGLNGAGIGGGSFGNGSHITILGGNITAVGGENAAGIGGGSNTDGGDGSDAYGRGTNITISGGVVTANGGAFGGAGIGGGNYGGQGMDISITGGIVIANGGGTTGVTFPGAGIGGGANTAVSIPRGGQGINISVTGGIVKVTAGQDASCIGGGYGGSSENVQLTGGIIFEGTSGQVYGTVTLNSDLEIGAGETLYIPGSSKLIIPDGVKLTNNGTITYEAGTQADAVSGNLVNHGTISGSEPAP